MTESYHTTTVSILGVDYPIKSDADPGYLHELARYVEEKIRSVSSRATAPASPGQEVLAALLIADEYFREKRTNLETEHKLTAMIDLVASALCETTGSDHS